MANDPLTLIEQFLTGELSQDGLAAAYYHCRLQDEVARRKQAEREAEHVRALLADLISQSIRTAKWAAVWKRAAKRIRANEGMLADQLESDFGTYDAMQSEINALKAQLAVATAPAPAIVTSVTTGSTTTDAPAATFPCPDCDFVAKDARGLGVHRSSAHRRTRTDHVLTPCPHCGITGLDGKPWASGHQRGGHVARCIKQPRPAPQLRDTTDPDPLWRCAVCDRPADVIAPAIADPSRCIACVKARKEAA